MKRELLLLLWPLLLHGQVPHFSYNHRELSLVNFTSPKIVSNIAIITSNPKEGDGIPDKWIENYHFTGDTAKVSLSGKGVPWTFQFDDQRRIKTIHDGSGMINFRYSTLHDTVISLPSDTVVTRHSRKYITSRNSEGDTVMMIVVPTDWKNDVPNSEFWDPSHSDTAWITRDSQGRISGVKRQFWKTNHFHSTPWKKETDSLAYSYTNAPDSSRTITSYFQHPVSEAWRLTRESRATVTKYNDDGLETLSQELRWDGAGAVWDSVYIRETRREYDGTLLKTSKEWLFWGTGDEPDSGCLRDELWSYQANPFSGSTAVTEMKSIGKAPLSLEQSSEALRLTLPGGFWNIALVDLRGRIVLQQNHTSSGTEVIPVSLRGVASGIYLMQIREKASGLLLSEKVVR